LRRQNRFNSPVLKGGHLHAASLSLGINRP
jgi:hypothetical protein